MDTSDIIAGFSLLFSIAAFAFSYFADKRLKNLDFQLKQKELDIKNKEEDEAKKADIEVNFVESPKGKTDFLRFYNKGNVEAVDVSFTIPSDSEDQIQLIMNDDYLPYPKLLPQQNFDIHFLNYSHKPHQTITITWNDSFAQGRSKEMIIDM